MALCIALASCGHSRGTVVEPVPVRALTAGDALLASAPAGADLMLEIDLARLRANAVAGPVLTAISGSEQPGEIADGDLLRQASAVLVCVYGVGDAAKQLIVVQATAGLELSGAAALGQGRFAVGDPEVLARAVGMAGSKEASMLEDMELARLRAGVMPPEAEAATVRAVARLDFDARVAVASRVGMSEVPVSLALWGDVVDDLAVVARVTGETPESLESLQQAVLSLRKRIASKPFIRFLGLGPALAAARVTRSGATVQVVLVLSPKRFALLAKRLVRQLQVSTPSSSQPSATND